MGISFQLAFHVCWLYDFCYPSIRFSIMVLIVNRSSTVQFTFKNCLAQGKHFLKKKQPKGIKLILFCLMHAPFLNVTMYRNFTEINLRDKKINGSGRESACVGTAEQGLRCAWPMSSFEGFSLVTTYMVAIVVVCKKHILSREWFQQNN